MNGRAGIQTHNCFLLKTDVIQENRGGMDFSKEDGAAIEVCNRVCPDSTQALCGLQSINRRNALVLISPTALFLESIFPEGHLKFSEFYRQACGGFHY